MRCFLLKPGLLLVLVPVALGGCTNGLAQRQAELSQWIGRPEMALVQAMGAPNRSYETGGAKFLTYEEKRVDIVPGTPFYNGFGPYWYGPGAGLPPQAVNLECDTTFTITKGIVQAFSLRGNACG